MLWIIEDNVDKDDTTVLQLCILKWHIRCNTVFDKYVYVIPVFQFRAPNDWATIALDNGLSPIGRQAVAGAKPLPTTIMGHLALYKSWLLSTELSLLIFICNDDVLYYVCVISMSVSLSLFSVLDGWVVNSICFSFPYCHIVSIILTCDILSLYFIPLTWIA